MALDRGHSQYTKVPPDLKVGLEIDHDLRVGLRTDPDQHPDPKVTMVRGHGLKVIMARDPGPRVIMERDPEPRASTAIGPGPRVLMARDPDLIVDLVIERGLIVVPPIHDETLAPALPIIRSDQLRYQDDRRGRRPRIRMTTPR